jgi:transcription antitermination factor NusG
VEEIPWHVWTANPRKFDIIVKFIRDTLPEVKDILVPTEVSERKLAKGKTKKQKTPLYGGYLFLQYQDSPSVWHRLNNHVFVLGYVGQCSGPDLTSVYNLRNVETLNKEEDKEFRVGDKVKVNCGPFKGTTGVVAIVRNSYIQVLTEAFGRNCVKTTFSPADLDIISRE